MRACCTHAGAVPRIFAAVACGHEHVAAEALRLLTRLWAPGSARSGQGPWVLPRSSSGPNEAGEEYAFEASLPVMGYDAAASARQAKSACLAPSGRCVGASLLCWTSHLANKCLG